MSKRLDSLQATLLNNTVLNDWFSPMQKALDKVRYSRKQFSVLSAEFFILLGCLRQLQAPCVRIVVASNFYLEEAKNESKIYRRI